MFAPTHRIDFVAQAAGRFSNTKMKPPEKWIPALIALMQNYQESGAIRSLDALLVTLCDRDSTAALMLNHILQWHHRSIRKDGAVWRSAEEWEQMTGLTRSMVYNEKRRERLKAAGLKVWVERAYGENTMHFQIDAAKLTTNIAKLLKLDYNIAMLKLWQIVPLPVPQAKPPIPFKQPRVSNDVPRVPNEEIPLTESSTEHSTKNTTMILLNSFSLSVDEKAKYAVLPYETVKQIVDALEKKKSSGKLHKPALAYLRASLKKSLAAHIPVKAAPSAETAAPIPNPSPAFFGIIPQADEPDWWIGARNQLAMQMQRNGDWPYLARLQFGEYTADGVKLLYPAGAPITLIQRYQRNIERAIKDTRFAPTKVIFAERKNA